MVKKLVVDIPELVVANEIKVVNKPKKPQKVANEPKPTPNKVANTDKPVVANNKHGKYADKEKRREYMKEYMRKLRAKK